MLGRKESAAVRRLVERVIDEVDADLVQAALFGSRARGEARPDSDLDVLLVFAALPPDREPQASDAERIAAEVASATRVPVTVWSVSLIDCRAGSRTPMLVDALEDAIPVWSRGRPIPPLTFTHADALRCAEALLMRIAEGSREFESALLRGDPPAAARRGRDDVVRLCVAWLLLHGVTRPRRATAIRVFERGIGLGVPVQVRGILEWAARSFGRTGRDDHLAVASPPGGLTDLARTIDWLREEVLRAGDVLVSPRRHPSRAFQGIRLAPGGGVAQLPVRYGPRFT
jgi:predicted nucleotidyltransferase